MRKIATFNITFASLLLTLFGCQTNNPIELNDTELVGENIELQSVSISMEPFDVSASTTTGFFAVPRKNYFGSFLLAGAEYDGITEHHEAATARAVFFDRSQPIIFDNDTIAYRATDAGVVSIDDLLLRTEPVRSDNPNAPIDSIGVQYALLNVDGIGGRGLEYFGKHDYQWDVSGAGTLPAFRVIVHAPEKLHVVTPSSGESFSLKRNVQFKWHGGGEFVTLLISDYPEGNSVKPLLQLRVRKNNGRLLLPKRIVQLLPENRTRFLFTFSSATTYDMHLDSDYRETIAVGAVTSHSLVYYLNR